MPSRIVTLYTCSMCGHEFRDGTRNFTLSGSDGTNLNYDVCSDCFIDAPFARVFECGEPMCGHKAAKPRTPIAAKSNGGRKAAAAPPPASANGTFSCPECSFAAKNPQGLGAHRYRHHGVVSAKRKQPA